MPSDCLVSIVLGMERDKTMTKPLLVPTHRVGQVDTVFSMKVQEKWRLRTRLPSSAITLRSGRQESGTSFSGINGVVSEENCSLFFSCTLAVWLLLKEGKCTIKCHILNPFLVGLQKWWLWQGGGALIAPSPLKSVQMKLQRHVRGQNRGSRGFPVHLDYFQVANMCI